MASSEATQQANRAEMDPKRLVLIAYLLFTVILGLFLGHLVALVFGRFNLPVGNVLKGIPVTLPEILGWALAIGGAVYCWTNPKIHALSTEVATELMRVTWPSWEETRVATLAVVVASLIASLILFGMDSLSYKVIVDWLPLVWGKL